MDWEVLGYRLGKLDGKHCVVWYEEEGGEKIRRRYRLNVGLKRPQSEVIAALTDFVRRREAAKLLEGGALTVEKLFLAYIDSRKREGKSVKNQTWTWNALRPTFAALRPADLEAPLMVEGEERTICHAFALKQEERGIARDTIWDRLSCLRTAMNWAYKNKHLTDRVNVWVPQKGAPRDVVAEEDEVLKILSECRMPHVRLFVLIAITTGARKTAILQLTWDRVDFERRIIDFRDKRQKSILDKRGKKGRSVVEFGVALELALREAKEAARTDHVIEWAGAPVLDIKKGLTAAIRRAGLSHRKIGAHVLRHSTATWLADESVDMRKIQKMLGHRDIRTTETIYAKYRRGYLSEAANVLDLKIARIK